MSNNGNTTDKPKVITDIRKMTAAELQAKFGVAFDEMVNDEEKTETLKGIFDKYLNVGFNFFLVSDMERREIKHSRVLSWFLRPAENPGAGGYILKEFLASPQIGWGNLTETDCETFKVVNEEFNIDILVYSEQLKKVVVIENKIDAAERTDGLDGGQLAKYYNYIFNSPKYRDCEKKFIFLSPDGRDPSAKNIGIWETFDYVQIKEVINNGWAKAKKAVAYQGKPTDETEREIDVLLKHYIKIIDRRLKMTVNKDFRDECIKFYLKHRDVLDATFSIAKDAARQINDFIWEQLIALQQEKGLILDEKINTNTSRYFTTPLLNSIAPKVSGEKPDCVYEFLTTNTDGSVLKCTIFRSNKKAEELRANHPSVPKAKIKSWPAQFTLKRLYGKTIIDLWLDDTEKAKAEISEKFNDVMAKLEEFEDKAHADGLL